MKNSRPELDAKRPRGREKSIEANADDKAFFEENGQFLSFLDSMDAATLEKYVSHIDPRR
jgi:hypothetical protein